MTTSILLLAKLGNIFIERSLRYLTFSHWRMFSFLELAILQISDSRVWCVMVKRNNLMWRLSRSITKCKSVPSILFLRHFLFTWKKIVNIKYKKILQLGNQKKSSRKWVFRINRPFFSHRCSKNLWKFWVKFRKFSSQKFLKQFTCF